jgi:hypothetical protein
MDDEQVGRALDPFFTTKEGKHTGLGLPLLAEAAAKTDGGLEVDSKPGKGTIIRAEFRRSHVDRQPLGSMVDTLLTLIIGNPGVVFIYTHRHNERQFEWNSEKVIQRKAGEGSILDLMETIETELRKGLETLE